MSGPRQSLLAAREHVRRALRQAKVEADLQGARVREVELGPHGHAAEVRAETERADRWEDVVRRLDELVTELDDLEREVEDLGELAEHEREDER